MKSDLFLGRRGLSVLIIMSVVFEMGSVEFSWGQTPPPPVITSSTPPSDVEIPQGFSGNPIAFFDDFSWKAFIAMVWPALQGQRGVPDPKQTVGGPGPRVFETYKALYEMFHSDGSAPASWNDFDPASYNPCDVAVGWGDLTLGSFSKFSDMGQAGFGSLVGPLVAQNTTYVRFLTTYNMVEYKQIVSGEWYVRAKLPTPPASITFDNGAIDTKSAWMDMSGASHPERYYTRTAWVLDPVTGECSQKKVGLVGLHMVVKTPSRPQWIWSTFEQVDNVPPLQPDTTGAFGSGTSNFNDGTGAPMPQKNPYPLQRVLEAPTAAPFNVERLKPIHPSTKTTNAAYRAALHGTVWENYQLVATQWPIVPNSPSTPGTPPNTFPGTPAPNDSTAFSNVTLETFDQKSVFTSCMNCHNVTKAPTDFLWSLNDHAFPAKSGTPNLIMKDPAMRALRSLLEQQ
jgi:hypothetical protein